MKAIKPEWLLWGVGLGVALLIVNRITGGAIVTGAASTITRAPADMVIGAADGLFGLPDTRTADSVSKCDAARAAGDDWAASFYCPAADFLRGLVDGK